MGYFFELGCVLAFLLSAIHCSLSTPLPGTPLPDYGAAGWFNMKSNVLLFHLDEFSGNSADTSGENHPVTNTKTGYGIIGPVRWALSFDGVDSCITVPDASDIQFGVGDFSIGLWAYYNGQTQWSTLIAKKSAGSEQYSLGISNGSWVSPGPGTALTAVVADSGGLHRVVAANPPSGWHHFAMVQSYSSGLTLFIDGKAVGSDTSVLTGTVNAPSQPLTVGCLTGYAGSSYNGDIDEVAVWGRALSTSEVSSLYSTK